MRWTPFPKKRRRTPEYIAALHAKVPGGQQTFNRLTEGFLLALTDKANAAQQAADGRDERTAA